MRALNSIMPSPFAVPARSRSVLAACIAATAFVFPSAGYGQDMQVPTAGAANAVKDRSPVDPATLSCSALKDELHRTGELAILSGPRSAWGDTFYGPAVPRCQFWQIPQFAFVRARDGLCGVGYICIEKPTVN